MAYPALVSKYATPIVKWYQTDFTVIIRVQVIDVHKYYLQVEPDHLVFSTTSNNKDYCLILYFYGGVIAEETIYKNVGREIKITLTKALKWYSWLRLTKLKEKNPLISYDQESLCTYKPQRNYAVKGNLQRGTVDLESKNNEVYYVLPYDESESESEDEFEDEDFD